MIQRNLTDDEYSLSCFLSGWRQTYVWGGTPPAWSATKASISIRKA